MMEHETRSTLHALTPEHLHDVLMLNNQYQRETSLLDMASLSALVAMACHARGVDGGTAAFLIALDEAAAYDNPNFNWFKARYSSFMYIDRVIVAPFARGSGLARALYDDLFAVARKRGVSNIVCEINRDPPNPASDALHQALGFKKVGEATIHGGAKTVSYCVKELTR